MMIRLEYPQPQQKTHKQVIWDLQALSSFHKGRVFGIISSHIRGLYPPTIFTCMCHTCAHNNTYMCHHVPLCISTLTCALWCCLFFSSPLLSGTLRQVFAELLRRQAGKQAHQQWGRGAVSLMSSKAVNTRIAMRSCICSYVYQPRLMQSFKRHYP